MHNISQADCGFSWYTRDIATTKSLLSVFLPIIVTYGRHAQPLLICQQQNDKQGFHASCRTLFFQAPLSSCFSRFFVYASVAMMAEGLSSQPRGLPAQGIWLSSHFVIYFTSSSRLRPFSVGFSRERLLILAMAFFGCRRHPGVMFSSVGTPEYAG